MKEYAANDVIYLPNLFNLFKENCEKKMFNDIELKGITKECEKYLNYSKINLNIKNFTKVSIEKDKKIEGLIKLREIFI
jgi:ribonuclease D